MSFIFVISVIRTESCVQFVQSGDDLPTAWQEGC